MTFFNIFSKKLVKKENKQKVIIDFREKNSLIASELSSLGIEIEFQHLQVADYIVGSIAMERKTISDLKGSIINKRIFQQMQELKQYPKHLLIIEGLGYQNIYEGIIHENALRGFLLSAALDYQIPIIFTQSEKDTALYLSILAKKKENKKISFRPSKINLTKEEYVQFILEGFHHIGPVKAKALIKKFKSLRGIFDADELELLEILGKHAKDFKESIEGVNY